MKKIMVILFVVIALVELFIVAGCFIDMKYRVEMTENMNEMFNLIYSTLNTLNLIIIFNSVYLLFLHLLFLKRQ